MREIQIRVKVERYELRSDTGIVANWATMKRARCLIQRSNSSPCLMETFVALASFHMGRGFTRACKQARPAILYNRGVTSRTRLSASHCRIAKIRDNVRGARLQTARVYESNSFTSVNSRRQIERKITIDRLLLNREASSLRAEKKSRLAKVSV